MGTDKKQLLIAAVYSTPEIQVWVYIYSVFENDLRQES